MSTLLRLRSALARTDHDYHMAAWAYRAAVIQRGLDRRFDTGPTERCAHAAALRYQEAWKALRDAGSAIIQDGTAIATP